MNQLGFWFNVYSAIVCIYLKIHNQYMIHKQAGFMHENVLVD